MNQAYMHLLTNHIPVFGLLFGTIILLWGIIFRRKQIKMAAYFLFIAACLGGLITFNTGEAAEDIAEKTEGISKSVIHDHEEAGEAAIYLIAGVGIIALFGFYAEVKENKKTSAISIAVLIVAIVAFILTARTSYLGGKIRHTEMSGKTALKPGQLPGNMLESTFHIMEFKRSQFNNESIVVFDFIIGYHCTKQVFVRH